MQLQNLIHVGVTVQALGQCNGVQRTHQVCRGQAAKLFGVCDHLCGLGWLAFGIANEGPINIGPQVFATNGPFTFALDPNAKRFANFLPNGMRLAQVTDRGLATSGKRCLLIGIKTVEV